MNKVRMTPEENERLKDLAETITSWLICVGRAIANTDPEHAAAARDHARSVVDAVRRI